MKSTRLLFLLTLILTGLTFSSCSDDDDDNNGGGTNTFGPKNVFTGDLPKSIGNATVKYNSDGLLEEIASSDGKATFEYQTTKAVNNSTIVIMKVTEEGYPEDNYTVKMQIGDNGFVTNALQTYADKLTDTWEFKYNSEGQLNYMKRSEGGTEITTITYTNGNITAVKMESEESEDIYTTAPIYTSEVHAKGIENKGCIMFFDLTFGIDMDEMDYAYYAGLLGRATKNLPLGMTDGYVGEPIYDDTYTYDWTLNDKGYPTVLNHDDGNENIIFGW